LWEATPNWGMYTHDPIIFWTCEPPHTRNHLCESRGVLSFCYENDGSQPESS